ncbi:N-acetyllactosaminide beta-1,3-N-acetylglucosaminyltransferase 3-like isoform X2 [Antennarius striatus]|uniref:N-acetyllactosaminide beta-1,3-N-acetylglucosaminyltransferase 3-like isoform X2 n=1 Tax=Antennarius striatus TaxID=241820 RepID=UPI0035B0D055
MRLTGTTLLRSRRSSNMFRFLKLRGVKTGFFLLLLGTPLLLVEFSKNAGKAVVVQNMGEDSQVKARKNSSYVRSWPSCQQNTSVQNITDFNNLPNNIKDFLYYRHCRHFPMLLDLPDKCGGPDKSAEVFLLLVVKSSPLNYDRREVLRKTWAKERLHNGVWIRRVFISGTSDSGFEKMRLNKLLELEHGEHSDILQWDFQDSLFNLTLKQILFLEWMERNCPNVRFLLNGDDDVFANTDNMVEFLQSLQHNDGGKHLFTGHLIKRAHPRRTSRSKYFIPVAVHQTNSYPPYCGGGGFLLSGYTASVIYNATKSVPILPIDDVYMGMCLAKAGLRPTSHVGMRTLGFRIPSRKIDGHDPCYYREVLVVHRFLPPHLYLLWHRLNDPNLTCDSPKKRFWLF